MNLQEATVLATKSIKHFLNPRFLTDENIGYVTNYILRAYYKFDKTKNTKLESWLYTYSRGACLHLVRDSKKKKNSAITNVEEFFMNNIEKTSSDPLFESDMFELISDILSEKEKIIFKNIYILDMSVEDCANEIKMSKQNVYTVIRRINKKVKNTFGSTENLKKWCKDED